MKKIVEIILGSRVELIDNIKSMVIIKHILILYIVDIFEIVEEDLDVYVMVILQVLDIVKENENSIFYLIVEVRVVVTVD